MADAELLEVDDLTIALAGEVDRPFAVAGLSLRLARGETLALVGESGSGKSMTAGAVMGLLPAGAAIVGGRVRFEGTDLAACSEAERESLRGRRIAMVFQEPSQALDPLMRVGDQIEEVFLAHGLLSRAERRERTLMLLDEVGLPDPATIRDAWPFQLSGGQKQRVMIACALALEPALLVADEPTTALDVTTQAQILRLIADLRHRRHMAVLFITHDLGIVADVADRVAVLHAGRLVEIGPTRAVLRRPRAEETRALLAAVPSLIPRPSAPSGRPPVLEVEGLTKRFVAPSGLGGTGRDVLAVDRVAFSLARGETLAIVGESGSGKSTLARCLVRLIEPDAGSIRIDGVEISTHGREDLRRLRRRVQMVFQDPWGSFNPRQPVGRAVMAGPLAAGLAKSEARVRARELLALVGLDPEAVDRYPHEFSGGQRQRLGIARALALEPEILIADEAVSALDVSVQAQILALFADLGSRLDLALIFITHDLRVAAKLADRVAVMRDGRIVEIGPADEVLAAPRDVYTRSLLAAVPGRAAFAEE